MSATATAVAEPAVEEAKKKKSKLIPLLIGVVVLLAGVAVYLFLFAGGDDTPVEPTGPPPEGVIIQLEPLVTTTGMETPKHARIGLAVVLVEGADATVIADRAPLLQDALLRHIAANDADTLRSAAGSDALRSYLTAAAQDIWPDGEVARVVLTELLVH